MAEQRAAEPLTVSVQKAGELVGLGRRGAYAAVARGDLPSIRIGRRILVPLDALHALLASAGHQPRR